MTASELLGNRYSIIGSVALFVAFQNWKAADDTSSKNYEALQTTQHLGQKTHLMERSRVVEGQ
ncbi:hypothetical protein MUN82_05270 [Hymenobacter aerilatus]|uniref:Uncharacterized protein n=1 Tax=Hymenobacter aerilatus TaxID=2932251 RepID=A0A8T9SZY7_9BACT|nr:hypothetical protein [Hymenobacter aerilatus]UOR06504.1 hypothetical protein MUN82_05270 [Hymenobacter aerilatus]